MNDDISLEEHESLQASADDLAIDAELEKDSRTLSELKHHIYSDLRELEHQIGREGVIDFLKELPLGF